MHTHTRSIFDRAAERASKAQQFAIQHHQRVATFDLLISISSITITVQIEAYYTQTPALPAAGLQIDTIAVSSILAVSPGYQSVVDAFPKESGLFETLEWEIYLRLIDGDNRLYGTPSIEMNLPQAPVR